MKQTEINEQTKLPLKIVMGAISFAVSSAIWLTVLNRDIARAQERLFSLESKMELLQKIDRRLYRIEIKLGVDQKETNP